MKDIYTYDCMPCTIPDIYFLNGVRFDRDDFGEREYGYGAYGGCADSHFEPFYGEQMNDALVKYKISTAEYYEIARFLEDLLDVGDCGWCI
jgi:hypothetical protein